MPKVISDWEGGKIRQRKKLQKMADWINSTDEKLKNIGKNQNLPLLKFIGCDEFGLETTWEIPARKVSM